MRSEAAALATPLSSSTGTSLAGLAHLMKMIIYVTTEDANYAEGVSVSRAKCRSLPLPTLGLLRHCVVRAPRAAPRVGVPVGTVS